MKYIEDVLLHVGNVSIRCMRPGDMNIDPDEFNRFIKRLVTVPVQTHSLNVGLIGDPFLDLTKVDALVSFNPAVAVGVYTADCVPVLIYAPDKEGIAAVHAGWRGTLGGIVNNTLDLLQAQGCDPSRMYAVIGPAISLENYEVDFELAHKFIDAGFSEFVMSGSDCYVKPHIDLKGVNRMRLLKRGLKPENITVSPDCTFSSRGSDGTHYPSHRRSGGSPLRMLSCISLNR